MTSNPYISIIITGRNDDYMKGGFERMKMVVQNYIDQAKKYNLNAELIIVDWNPPADKPLLKDALPLPKDLGGLTIRFIVVPHVIHSRYRASKKIKIINVAAFNVGIRRAKGAFIMATNADILLSNELIEYISLKTLEKNHFYRAFRYDVDRSVLKQLSLESRMDFCRRNVIKAFLENEILSHPKGFKHHPVLQTDCGGDFILFAKEHWQAIHGYPETNNLGLASDVLLCYMAYLSGLKEMVLEKSMKVYHIDHDSRWRGLSNSKITQVVRNTAYRHLKTGNRLLILMKSINMVKSKTFSFFIDNFYTYFAPLFESISPRGSWDFNTRYLLAQHKKNLFGMLSKKRSYIYNGEDWGFPNEHFKEY